MRYPSRKEIREMAKKLENAEGSRPLPPDAGPMDILKYELCRMIILYLHDHRMTQAEFAARFGIDPARLSEIVRYRIDKFRVEKIFEYASAAYPGLQVSLEKRKA